MDLSIVILAAGKGKRMCSDLPKVLQKLAGKPLLEHLVNTVRQLGDYPIYVVYGNHGEKVKETLSHLPVIWVKQEEQLGTGHAVLQVLPKLKSKQRVLILNGDVPLISIETIKKLLERTSEDGIGWVTANLENPKGLGRVIRDADHNPQAIVEEKDATANEKEITEINTNLCLVPVKYLKSWLPEIKNTNAQKEYYLTDIFSIAVENGINITTVSPEETFEVLGVNNKVELAALERIYQEQQAKHYMLQGLSLIDPKRFDIRGELKIKKDIVMDINVVIEGEVSIGHNCYIGPNVTLKNVKLGNNVEVKSNSVLEDSEVGDDCVIGPFARIRPETKLKNKVKVGNFVEIKKSTIDSGSKVNHLSYIGDTTMGKDVNVGAGTITCNYDGAHKYHTTIEDDVFIGSDSQLVAPVKIGKGATIGAGSTVTDDVPSCKLMIARARPVVIECWKRPKKEKDK